IVCRIGCGSASVFGGLHGLISSILGCGSGVLSLLGRGHGRRRRFGLRKGRTGKGQRGGSNDKRFHGRCPFRLSLSRTAHAPSLRSSNAPVRGIVPPRVVLE